MLKQLIEAFTQPFRRTPPRVELDDLGVRRLFGGREEYVRWDDVVEIGIVTTDEGPFACDFYWMFIGTGGAGVALPSDLADGIFDYLQRFPGFDYEAVILASGCTDNESFVAWRREVAEPIPARLPIRSS